MPVHDMGGLGKAWYWKWGNGGRYSGTLILLSSQESHQRIENTEESRWNSYSGTLGREREKETLRAMICLRIKWWKRDRARFEKSERSNASRTWEVTRCAG